jgi:chemotaxis response regulator CheB
MFSSHPRPSPLEVPRLLVVTPDAGIRQLVRKAIPEHKRSMIFLVFSDNLASVAATPPPDVVLINLKTETRSDFSQLSKVWLRWPSAQVIFLSPSDDIHLWAEAVQLGPPGSPREEASRGNPRRRSGLQPGCKELGASLQLSLSFTNLGWIAHNCMTAAQCRTVPSLSPRACM